MATSTPWGSSQYKVVTCRGVTFHSTSRHGGFLISKGYAEKNLSAAAIKRGESFGNYLAYEEDCLASIIILEIPETRESFSDLTEEIIIRNISYFNADYLIERGIEPEPQAYKRFLENKEYDRRRRDKDPDLIVSAMRLEGTEVVKVITADGQYHFVTEDSYTEVRRTSRGNNLSFCEIVKDFVQTSDLHY